MRFFQLIVVGIVLALSSVADRAFSQSPSVPSILKAWRRTIGVPPRHGALHQRFASKEEGVPGVVEQWITPSGRLRRNTVSYFDSNELLVIPAIGQSRDWNGFVRNLDGTELARVRSQAFIAAALAFGPPAVMIQAKVAPAADPHRVALIFKPSHGSSVK